MSTEQAFVIHNGSYDEEADESKNVLICYVDEDYLNFEPPLSGCSLIDILELANWIAGEQDNEEE